MIICKNCGANMRFDIEKQSLICDYCGSSLEVSRTSKADIKSEEQLMDAICYTCSQCGAKLYTTEETAATFCSYCGSSILLESRMTAVNKPDFIIPFKITKEEAAKAYTSKIRRAIFAPASFKKAEIESLRGIYMPYWEYYMDNDVELKFRTNENSRSNGSYTYTDIYDVSMSAHITSDGLEYDASSKLPDDLSQTYAPFNFKEAKLFNPSYMSGFYADLGNVNSETYTQDAAEVVSRVASQEIYDHCNLKNAGVQYKDIEKQVVFPYVEPGLAMYPVWFASARSKNGKYINYAAVNGQTGKVAADLPVDKKKILLWTIIFAIPIFAVIYILLKPNIFSTLLIISALSIVGAVIGNSKLGYMSNLLSRDKGMKHQITDAEKKQRKKESSKIFWKTFFGVAICVAVYLLKPVQDIYYYGAAVAASILCLWNYWRIFELHNQAIVRPLPQLDKRGGDDK